MSRGHRDNPTILIFDSGVGGLSVYQEVRRLLPGARYVYASDNEAFPYGIKPEEMVVSRVDDVLQRLMQRFAPDVMVIACNTASTVALPRIRGRIAVPVVGVVPAVKPAAQISRSGVIGLLATPATIERAYTQNLIDEFARGCTVVRVGSSELVDMAEDKLRGTAPDTERIRTIIAPLFKGEDGNKVDTVVLGCTHFPLLRTELASTAPRNIAWIDSGPAIAKRVRFLLKSAVPSSEFEMEPSPDEGTLHQAAFTRESPDVSSLEPALRKQGFSRIVFL